MVQFDFPFCQFLIIEDSKPTTIFWRSLRLSQSSIRKGSSFGLPLVSSTADSFRVNILFQLMILKLGRFTMFLSPVFASLPWCASKGAKFVSLLETNRNSHSALSINALNSPCSFRYVITLIFRRTDGSLYHSGCPMVSNLQF